MGDHQYQTGRKQGQSASLIGMVEYVCDDRNRWETPNRRPGRHDIRAYFSAGGRRVVSLMKKVKNTIARWKPAMTRK